MPSYTVWYSNKTEPLEFATAFRPSELQILEHILQHENIAPVAPGPTVAEIIAANQLAPVRYTEDESEVNTIG